MQVRTNIRIYLPLLQSILKDCIHLFHKSRTTNHYRNQVVLQSSMKVSHFFLHFRIFFKSLLKSGALIHNLPFFVKPII